MREVKRDVPDSKLKVVLPGVILAVSLLICAGYAAVTSAHFNGGNAALDKSELEIEKKIASGGADAETWMDYAQLLQGKREYGFAAEAYERVLDETPFERNAQMELCVCYALTGDDAKLKELLSDLSVHDAKLALEIMERPELGSHMAGSDFVDILAQARDQAND